MLKTSIYLIVFTLNSTVISLNAKFINEENPSATSYLGAIIRADSTENKLALIFTGDQYADGAETILDVLSKYNINASFFLTGNFYSNKKFQDIITRMIDNRHYLGAHSDKHLLYCDWNNREKLLISKCEFFKDLIKNYKKMKTFGIEKKNAPYFLPPYEWYNENVSSWTREFDLNLINFTPGTLSHADYTIPDTSTRYYSSKEILKSIYSYDKKHKNGLNGFILLMHVGTHPNRNDKLYHRLEELLNYLLSKSYQCVRIDRLLED
jgi:peptidoglycan/xylan/chitin deacetylase (PgdA/CDA1 family)